jgi:transcriptional regulator GlxA family with amidase domain
MHQIAVVAVPPVTTFDLSIPEFVFPGAQVGGHPVYHVVTCTADPGPLPTNGTLRVHVPGGLDATDRADTVIVTGTGARDCADPRVLEALRKAAERGARIVSICTGAFVLAQAGLLDGRTATTYWLYASELRRRFPAIRVQTDVLYVDDGQVLTSAGLSAGIDLCVHIIRTDHGAAVANTVARLAIAPPMRDGGQQQRIELPAGGSSASLASTRAWAASCVHAPLTLSDLASHAQVSVRTLTRRFRAETGMTPRLWLHQQRVDRARELLESTELAVEEVARRSGMGSADSLRSHLIQATGLAPRAYRSAFRQRRGQDSE